MRQYIIGFICLICLGQLKISMAEASFNSVPGDNSLKLTAAEKQFLSKHKVVRLGVDPDWKPFEFFDDSGNYRGIASSYIQLLRKKLSLDFVPVHGLSWQQVIEKIKKGELDVLPAVMKTPERQQYLNFTRPYISYPYMIFVHRKTQKINDMDDLQGLRVGVEKSYASESLLHNRFPDIYVKTYRNTGQVLVALANGEVDAYIGALASTTQIMQQMGMEDIKVAAPTHYYFDLAMAVRKDLPQLYHILDKALASISNQERREIKNQWFSVKVYNKLDDVKLWKMLLPVLLVFALIVIIILYWNKRLHEEITQKEQAERELANNLYWIKQLLEALPTPFFAKDSQLRYRYANKKFRDFVGKTEEELIGKSVDEVYDQEHARKYKLRDENVLLKQHVVSETVMFHHAGSAHDMIFFESALFNQQGQNDGIMGLFIDITERKQAERALAESREKYHHLVANIPGAIYQGEVDEQWSFVYISDAVEKICGYPWQVFIEQKSISWNDLILPQDRDRVIEEKWQSISNNQPYDLEYQIKSQSGDLVWINEKGQARYDQEYKTPEYIQGVLFDISRQKEIEHAIARNEARLKAIFDATTSVAFIIADNQPQPQITEFSPGAQETYGYRKEEIIGQPLSRLYCDEDAVSLPETIELLKGGLSSLQGEMSVVKKDGSVFPAIFSLYPLFDNETKYEGVLLVTIDITQRKQNELELKQAKQKAVTASEFKSRFLANMSHEIRTPMNAIVGFSYLLRQSSLDESQLNYVNKIQSSSNSLLAIINDILDYSKIEAGKITLEQIPFTLDDVLQNLSDLVIIKAQEKGLEILFDVPHSVPQHLLGDPLRLGQVLLNLVQNAIKFTEKGEIILAIHLKSEEKNSCQLLFEVKDTGIGISAEKQRSLFDSFTQADTSTTRKYGGTGLGLAISQHLVSLMGGQIQIKSKINRGSNFYFKLTFHKQRHPAKEQMLAELGDTRVLVIDDNEAARMILQNILRSFSMQVDTVSSGSQALLQLEQACKDQNPYQLILVDWQMPEMDGLETIERIRNSQNISTQPAVIMITAHGKEDIAQQAAISDIDAYLLKPISPGNLYDVLNKVLLRTEQNLIRADKANAIKTFAPLEGEVLLVEDNEINREVANAILQQFGLTIISAENAEEALEKLEQHNFDMVITDIQMPGMDGYQLTQKIRLQEKWYRLPIIAMTAHAMSGDREKCLQAGMNEYISKPIDPQKSYEVLSRWLKTSNRKKPEQHNDTVKTNSAANALLDIDWGVQRTGGDLALYIKLMGNFIQNHKTDNQRIRDCLQQKDFEQLQRILHTLKGVGGNIGAQKLANNAKQLEKLIKAEKITEFEAAIDSIERDWQQLIETMEQWLESRQRKTYEVDLEDYSKDEILQRFEELLKEGDSRSLKCYGKVETLLATGDNHESLKQLEQSIEDYDFDQALTVYRKIYDSNNG